MEIFENGGTSSLKAQPKFEKIILSKRKEGVLWGKKDSSTFKKIFNLKAEFTSWLCTVFFSKNDLLKNKLKKSSG